jgi:hypothetical protein
MKTMTIEIEEAGAALEFYYPERWSLNSWCLYLSARALMPHVENRKISSSAS